MEFTDEDQIELDKLEKQYSVLSAPGVTYHAPPVGGIFSLLLSMKTDPLAKLKKELASLRTRKKIFEEGLDPEIHYYRVLLEEENKLNNRESE